MSYTLMLVDIGNTRATYGIYSGARILDFGSCKYTDIPKIFKNCSIGGDNHQKLISISSVVPSITKSTVAKIKGKSKKNAPRVWVVGKDIKIPVKHKYNKSNKLGIDRLVNIYGALRIYKAPLLMIDFGTAITFDYVSEKEIFEGGMIIPGPETSFQALLAKAALIPKSLRLPEKSKGFLGKNTYDCISNGTLEGYGAMTDGLILRFKEKYGKKLKVIATGGFTKNIKPFSKELSIVDPDHTIKSLLLLTKTHMNTQGIRP